MDALRLTVACLVLAGATLTPPAGWHVDAVTAQAPGARVVLSTTIAYAEPFRWPGPGCASVAVEAAP